MKKLLVLILALVMCLGLIAGCAETTVEEDIGGKSMFVIVEKSETWQVVYHRESKVMYAVSRGYYNSGTFTLMVNADGTPMLWKE